MLLNTYLITVIWFQYLAQISTKHQSTTLITVMERVEALKHQQQQIQAVHPQPRIQAVHPQLRIQAVHLQPRIQAVQDLQRYLLI